MNNYQKPNSQHFINNQIRANKILLLDKDGAKIGLVSFREAINRANESELDLVQMSEDKEKDLAVCKMLKYDSWIYHEKKRKEKQEQKNKSQEIKEMDFRPVIGENDLKIKLRKVEEFLKKSHKVKIVIKMKNREFMMKEVNESLVNKILTQLKEFSSMDSSISYSAKEISFLLKPEKVHQPLKMKM